MGKSSGQRSTFSSFIATLLLAVMIVLGSVLVLEIFSSSGYFDGIFTKLVKEIPFGRYLGKFSYSILKQFSDMAKNMVEEVSFEPYTGLDFLQDLIKTMLTALLIGIVEGVLKIVTGVDVGIGVLNFLKKVLIKIVAVFVATAVSVLVLSFLSNVLNGLTSGNVWTWIIHVGALLLTMGIGVLAAYVVYGTLSVGIIVLYVLCKTFLLKMASVLLTYVVTLIVIMDLASGHTAVVIFRYFPTLVVLVFVIAIFENLLDKVLPEKR